MHSHPYPVHCYAFSPISSALLCILTHIQYTAMHYYPYPVHCYDFLPIYVQCTAMNSYPHQVHCYAFLPISSALLCIFTHIQCTAIISYSYMYMALQCNLTHLSILVPVFSRMTFSVFVEHVMVFLQLKYISSDPLNTADFKK